MLELHAYPSPQLKHSEPSFPQCVLSAPPVQQVPSGMQQPWQVLGSHSVPTQVPVEQLPEQVLQAGLEPPSPPPAQ
jgi:hypothetical protein